MQSRQQSRVHNALSLTLSGTKVLKKATEELPKLRTGGGFNFTFFIYKYVIQDSYGVFRFVFLFLNSY